MKFKVEINLGNDEMRLRKHVAAALAVIQVQLITQKTQKEGVIRDLNGNTVGKWTWS